MKNLLYIAATTATLVASVTAQVTSVAINRSPTENQALPAWQQFLNAIKMGDAQQAKLILKNGLASGEIDACANYKHKNAKSEEGAELLWHALYALSTCPESDKDKVCACIHSLLDDLYKYNSTSYVYLVALFGNESLLEAVITRFAELKKGGPLTDLLTTAKPTSHFFDDSHYALLDTHISSSTLTPLMAIVQARRVIQEDASRRRLLTNANLLLKKGSSPDVVCNVRIRRGQYELTQSDKTPLELAIRNRDIPLIELMLPKVSLLATGEKLIAYAEKNKAYLGYCFASFRLIKPIDQLDKIIRLIKKERESQKKQL